MCCLITFGGAQAADNEGAMTLNGNTTVQIGKGEYRARISAALKPSAKALQNGGLDVDQLNLVIFDVPQSDITKREAVGHKTGTLGFSVTGQDAKLAYNPDKRIIEGTLRGSVNVPGFIDPDPKPIGNPKERDQHVFAGPLQNATLKLVVALDTDLNNLVGVDKLVNFKGDMKFGLEVAANKELAISGYAIDLQSASVVVDFGWWFEFARNLCVQPVRIGRFVLSKPWPYMFKIQYTGDGLPFGQPGAITEWKKADLTFHWNEWLTVFDAALWNFSEGESWDLMASVDDPECVEVFFVDTFVPTVFWGGGGTYYSGTPDAKIISTDQNADFGVDLTHLAHELGHAVSLCHPNDPWCEARPEMNPSSTGTLMCPSGFNNDNPKVNSAENKASVNNSLTTFTLKPVSAGPDCTNDADCGPCP